MGRCCMCVCVCVCVCVCEQVEGHFDLTTCPPPSAYGTRGTPDWSQPAVRSAAAMLGLSEGGWPGEGSPPASPRVGTAGLDSKSAAYHLFPSLLLFLSLPPFATIFLK